MTASNIAKQGIQALQQGDYLGAIAAMAQAITQDPENHVYKIQFCQIIRDAEFQKPEPKLANIVLKCLKTTGIDHQNLANPWFSLLICDPNFKALQNFLHGEDFAPKKLQTNLKDPFFILGLEKLIIYDIRFEQMIARLCDSPPEHVSISEQTKEAIEQYGLVCEYVFTDKPPTQDLYPIDKDIPSLGISKDKTSETVRAHYEENPYPRWTSIDVIPAPKKPAEPYEHLIAGCGTGYGTCATALRNPHANITAIDLSLPSLSYAKKKAEELELKNIKFMQADILNLKDLDQKFDVIECSGVLHHMDDPIKGWKSLLEKLNDDGRMHIGLYSEFGRQDVVAARTLISEHELKPTHQGIKKAREIIIALEDTHPARNVMLRRDFFATSSCRDLIFHSHEKRFMISTLAKMLKELGLEFKGFSTLSPITQNTYRQKVPNDPNMLNLETWQAFEQQNPDTFRGMYQFWCARA